MKFLSTGCRYAVSGALRSGWYLFSASALMHRTTIGKDWVHQQWWWHHWCNSFRKGRKTAQLQLDTEKTTTETPVLVEKECEMQSIKEISEKILMEKKMYRWGHIYRWYWMLPWRTEWCFKEGTMGCLGLGYLCVGQHWAPDRQSTHSGIPLPWGMSLPWQNQHWTDPGLRALLPNPVSQEGWIYTAKQPAVPEGAGAHCNVKNAHSSGQWLLRKDRH